MVGRKETEHLFPWSQKRWSGLTDGVGTCCGLATDLGAGAWIRLEVFLGAGASGGRVPDLGTGVIGVFEEGLGVRTGTGLGVRITVDETLAPGIAFTTNQTKN